MMFNRNAFDNSRPDGMPVLEVQEKDGKEPGPRRFVPLVRSDLSGEVLGSLASLKLVQVFRYSQEQMGTDLNLSPFEAAYRFPLPGDAAVRGVTVRFGEVEIEAVLREREQAEEEYREAKEKGQQAALLNRESPNVFTLLVAGLQPGEETTVTTQFVQLARAEGSGWTLRIPLTTAPRYVRSDELDSRAAQGQPLALLRDPGHRFSLDLQFPAMTTVQSDTHALTLSIEENGVRVQLEGGEVLPDRDCLLSWQPPQEKARPNLQAFLQTDSGDPFSYFLAFVVPPADSTKCAPVPREVILLVDHSGSMEGPKWEAADWAAKKFLSGLTPQDCFALGLFHNTTTWLAEKPLTVSELQVQEAVRFLQSHRDSGGTELGVALEQALSLPRDEVQRSRHVLLITDAEVSDSDRILRLAEEEAKKTDRRRISVLTIDAAPNAYLVQELAEKGGGIARFLTSNPEEEDIATALDEVLADWSQPLYGNVSLVLDRPGVEAAGRIVHYGAKENWIDLGDLPGGRTLALSGRFPQKQGLLRLVLRTGKEELARLELLEQAGMPSHPDLPALFGARRVLALENLAGSGLPPEELVYRLSLLGYGIQLISPEGDPKTAPLYAENARRISEQTVKALLVKEALSFGLASRETSFVAIRKEQGKKAEGTVIVANALPAGWSGSFLAPPPMMAYSFAAGAPPMALDATPISSRKMKTGRARAALQGAPEAEVSLPRGSRILSLFDGMPSFLGSQAVLFDSRLAKSPLPCPSRIRKLMASVQGSFLPLLSGELLLWLFVGDLTAPRAKVALADLLRAGGERPLNLSLKSGETVLLTLRDPRGEWPSEITGLEIRLELAG